MTAVGDASNEIALPVAALVYLEADPLVLAALLASESIGWPFIGLLAGALVDRWNTRTVLLAAYLGRCAAIGSLALAVAAGGLTLLHLFAVVIVTGLLGIFEGVAEAAALPALVPADRLVAANGKVSATETAADSGAVGFVGVVIEKLSLAVAFAGEAVLSLLAAASLARSTEEIGSCSTASERSAISPSGLWAEIRAGIAVSVRPGLFRTTLVVNLLWNVAVAFQFSVIFLYLDEVAGLGPIGISVVFAAASIGSVVGAARADALMRVVGSGRAWRGALIVGVLGSVVMAVPTFGSNGVSFAVGFGLLSAGSAINAVLGSGLRQRLCPADLIGRVSAATRTITWSLIPIAVIAGGLVVELTGIRVTLAIASLLFGGSVIAVLISPLGDLHDLEEAA